jgi:hypothetical protein
MMLNCCKSLQARRAGAAVKWAAMRIGHWLTGFAALVLSFVLAAPAMAAKGGEGLYGKTDDKVITNFGFGLMILFVLLVTGLSIAQWQLEKRKQRK